MLTHTLTKTKLPLSQLSDRVAWNAKNVAPSTRGTYHAIIVESTISVIFTPKFYLGRGKKKHEIKRKRFARVSPVSLYYP